MIQDRKDSTLDEMVERLTVERDLHLGPLGAERLAWPAGLDVQRKTANALEQERPDVLKRRQTRFESQLDLDPARLVLIDGERDE